MRSLQSRLLPVHAVCSAVFCLALGGCGEDSSEPVSGTWAFSNGVVRNNSCNYDDIDVSSGDFEVINHHDGTLTIDPNDGGALFDCELDGSNFVCPERLDNETDVMGGTLRVHVAIDGSTSSSTKASGVQDIRVECTGSGCPGLAQLVGTTFPCGFELPFTAKAS